ncbi:hypothetical protein [Streptomyces violascens]|uniref:hypothetical protein n=1 Tax=Streptomyces violascens TaxID=67381 RepID=UPI0036A2C8BB
MSGVALTGTILAYGACTFFTWVGHHRDQACKTTDGLCWTWWDWAAIPLTLTIALTVLAVVYKRLEIRPRIAVIPPTLLLAPLPLAAAHTTADCWAAAITGGAWACSLALTTCTRYRIPGASATAALLLAALIVLYR